MSAMKPKLSLTSLSNVCSSGRYRSLRLSRLWRSRVVTLSNRCFGVMRPVFEDGFPSAVARFDWEVPLREEELVSSASSSGMEDAHQSFTSLPLMLLSNKRLHNSFSTCASKLIRDLTLLCTGVDSVSVAPTWESACWNAAKQTDC